MSEFDVSIDDAIISGLDSRVDFSPVNFLSEYSDISCCSLLLLGLLWWELISKC